MTEILNPVSTAAVFAASPDPATKKMSEDKELMVSLAKLFNACLKFAETKNQSGSGLLATSAGGIAAMSSVTSKAIRSDGAKMANFGIGQAAKSLSLSKLANASPTKAVVTVGFVLVEKTVMTLGLGERHKCQLAIAQLVATGGLTATSMVGTAPTGIGPLITGVIGAIAIASDAFNVYNKCEL